MKSPEPQGPEKGRRGTTVSGSLPDIDILCVRCTKVVKGIRLGTPTLFCTDEIVRDEHARQLRLLAPRAVVEYREARMLCQGVRFEKSDQEIPFPIVRRVLPGADEGRCPVCGKLFLAGSNRQVYCSDKCRNRAKLERERERRAGGLK